LPNTKISTVRIRALLASMHKAQCGISCFNG